MGSDFAIFRDPSDGIIRAWEGAFKPVENGLDLKKTGFYFKPWQGGVQSLEISKIWEPSEAIFALLQGLNFGNVAPDYREQTPEAFSAYVSFGVSAISQGDFKKIVAARSAFQSKENIAIEKAFFTAVQLYPDAFVSLIYHSESGLWLGATPEKFIHYHNGRAETVALAGTLTDTSQHWTAKEKQEQSDTAEYVGEQLAKFQAEMDTSQPPIEVQQGQLRHLKEVFTFGLDASALYPFLESFHPTPAVGGYPKKEALAFIDRFESLDRQRFAGWMGWCEEGKFNSWVNLRCTRIYESGLLFFAGCGLNAMSNPEKEWNETEAKIEVIARCFRD